MKSKTLFGGVIRVAIPLLIAVIVLQGLYHVHQTEVRRPVLFMLLMATAGGMTGGVIASPLTDKN